MGDMQPLDSAAIRVQIDHLGDSLQSLTAKVDLLVDMTRAVAVLKADSENHMDLTRQIEASLRDECHRLDAEMRTEQSARGQVEKELAQRVDALRRWTLMVSGGGVVVFALLGYVGEMVKTFANEYTNARESTIRFERDLERMQGRVDNIHGWQVDFEKMWKESRSSEGKK